jgi:hypothetical protein
MAPVWTLPPVARVLRAVLSAAAMACSRERPVLSISPMLALIVACEEPRFKGT